MKKGDMVYIKGMQGGPYEVQDFEETIIKQNGLYLYIPIVNVNGERLYFDNKLLEPAEPEIEVGRIVECVHENLKAYGLYQEKGIENHIVEIDGIDCEVLHPKPVHFRWEELDIEKKKFFKRLEGIYGNKGKSIYKEAYQLITGEEHP